MPPLKNKVGNFVSPLRYPGGKGRIGPWLAKVIDHNQLKGGCYVEPYAGGAGAALYLLLHGHVDRLILNDADPAVFLFWDTLVNHPQKLIEQVERHEPTMETRFFAKEVLKNSHLHKPEEVAFATFFLNRTSRSGILNGGVVGGKHQAGKYKLDARYKREDLLSRIEMISQHAEKIEVYGEDAIDLLKRIAPQLPSKSLIYMDPPYYLKGSLLYRNCYGHDDHVALAEAIKALNCPLLISYDNADEIREIFQELEATLFSFTYSTHLSRPLASEVLFSKNIILPSPPIMTRKASLD